MTEQMGCSRRRLLGAAGLAGAGVLGVGACATRSAKAVVPPAIKGKVIARTSEIPVGGGKVLDKWKIVLAQPSQGTFKAFSATCPHQGCAVGSPEDGVITCPCHGSEFDATDGSVRHGPADAPLKEFTVRLQGDGITVE
jgi:nitrite reductase/ring-hydroxylating ferredoxin subunit